MKKLVTVAEVGVRIREIRKAQGVSQETLAGLAGTGQRYISELERGKTTARLGEMLKVLNALGVGLYVLSPMYDVMSTALYPDVSPRMAMKIDRMVKRSPNRHPWSPRS